MSVRSELELAESPSNPLLEDAFELQEHEFILDPDEADLAAEARTGTRPVRPLPPPPPPPRRPELRVAAPLSGRSRSPSGVFPVAAVEEALAAHAGVGPV
jgi:hypothetical protein